MAIACGGALISESSELPSRSVAVSALVGVVATMWAARWTWWPRLSGSRAALRGFASAWWWGRLASQANYASYIVLGTLLFTDREVGLIVWALAVTSVPTILAPLASRVLFPNMIRAETALRTESFGRMLTLLTLVSLPLVAVLFVLADRLPSRRRPVSDATVLVRLECVTTVLGVVITPSARPFTLDPRRVARLMVLWALGSYLPAVILATWLGYELRRSRRS